MSKISAENLCAKDRIILAVDVDSRDAAIKMAELHHNSVGAFKIGLELVNNVGIDIFQSMKDAGASRIFYDCKVHDIPNTVAGAMKAIARQGLWMTNLHASGGSRMINAAARALADSSAEAGFEPPILLGVTLLTSISLEELHDELHARGNTTEYVQHMAKMVQDAGGQGVVASPHEIEAVRAVCGPNFLIVTPGVRPAGVAAGDQRRVMTPGDAIRRGADYLVVGRAITAADDPGSAAAAIADEIGVALAE